MSIATYGDLKTSIANWLNRSNLTARIPEFISLCETRVFYGHRGAQFNSEPLRIRAMEQSSFATISSQKVPLPDGFLAPRRLYLNTDPIGELEYITPDIYWRKWISSTSGQPRQYTIEGENFVFGPTPDGSYDARVLFYKKFDALSADADTNWLLTNAPGVYLHGSLLEAHLFTRNQQMALGEFELFAGAANALNLADKSDRFPSPWVANVDIWTP